ncbi:Anthocyanidin reductase [Morus notabilis]|uniref:Anthocyanidin reductase n=1 Tax=Morus notabilis TaxID=981085 RepID=W9S8P7_9ROSA|nr:cinnamoyl-CoA reductase-like SNL6 [Morus notabilis]EXC20296.1 Anthocyanidin reductase [Morus notabilis]
MGIVNCEERERMEIEEFRRMVVASGAATHRRKDHQGFDGSRLIPSSVDDDDLCDRDRPVCVTSGLSFLGIALVNNLLARGYSVRIVVENPEDLEIIQEMETTNSNISATMARLTDVESLPEAFKDCRGVFHTSSFIDPTGVSGYTKYMVDVEARASENVIKACARTPSVKKCVFTSSLLACLWQDRAQNESNSSVINHDCWSDESVCIDKKLWYALGKIRAEKSAWKVAEESGLNMATLCPGLITGPEFCSRNSTATFAYLKGAEEMYESGVLATMDVDRLAEAHVCVFEALNKTTGGRYVCFDRVIQEEEDAEKLASEMSMPKTRICGTGSSSFSTDNVFQLSDKKLSSLMSTALRPCYNQSCQNYTY